MISIQNENLAIQVMFQLDKEDNQFEEEELFKIEEVVIDYQEEEDSSFLFLEELLKLKHLKRLTLRNGYIFNDNYSIFLRFPFLEEVTFDQCEFENADLIASLSLRSLALINCHINDYSFLSTMRNLEELMVMKGGISLSKLSFLTKLKFLQLSYCSILEEGEFSIPLLEELWVDHTTFSSFEFLKKLSHLRKLYIDEEQYLKHQELFDSLKNVEIMDENRVPLGGDHNVS